MSNNSVKRLALYGIMIAFVFLATYSTRIPTPLPGGYFNLGDSIIMLAAVFLGPIGGLITGGIGSCLADMAAGALIFAPITLVVKGIEGLAAGLLAAEYIKTKSGMRYSPAKTASGGRIDEAGKSMSGGTTGANKSGALVEIRLVSALAAGAIIMVAGYFFAEAFVLSIFDKAFGIAAAAGELVPNFIQGGLSAVIAYFLILLLSNAGVQKFIRE